MKIQHFLLSCVCQAGLVAVPAQAQSAASPPAPAPANDSAAPGASAVPDIIVTARKRSETAQSIPISIGVVGEKALAMTGSASLLQLADVAPGLNLAKGPVGAEIGVTVRGLGSAPGATSFDSSVSLFVDGVYAPRGREFASSMFDVSRIEVIKGTQAALLGKNTSLGAVNVITRKPGDSFAGDLRASYEFEQGSTLVTGGLDLPITQNLALRVSGQTLDDEGWVSDSYSGWAAPRTRDDAVRGVLVWKPTSGIDATLMVQHDVSTNYGNMTEFATVNPLAQQLATAAGAAPLSTSLDDTNQVGLNGKGTEQFERLAVDRAAGTVNIEVGGGTLTSVTAYSHYTDANNMNLAFLPGDYATRAIAEISREFSQEVRFVSPAHQPFEYLVGALYLHNELQTVSYNYANYPFGPVEGVNFTGAYQNDFFQKTDTFSVFGQGTYNASDKLHFLAGLRYTNEHKVVDLDRLVLTPGLYSEAVFPPYAPFTMGRRDKPVDYSFGAQYAITPGIMGYVSYGKGTKSGGFASSATYLDQSGYNSETARTVEAGIKAQDSARRWLFDLSVFQTNVDNFQVVTFNGVSFDIFNTNLRSTGFELQTWWVPVKGVRVFLNNTYDNAHDRNTGQIVPLAPKWSGSGGVSLREPMTSSLDAIIDGSIDYRSSRSYQQDPAASVMGNAFTTYNLGLAVAPAGDRWEVRLIGRNLTNAKGIAFSFPTPFIGTQSVMLERSRTIALQASLKF